MYQFNKLTFISDETTEINVDPILSHLADA